MSKLDKDQVIEKFTQAYQKVNGKAPNIEAKSGWYSVDGGKNIRLAQLDEMADELSQGKTEVAPAAKPAEKKAAKPKKAAPKVKKTPKKGGFSVKQSWGDQLAEGSRRPR